MWHELFTKIVIHIQNISINSLFRNSSINFLRFYISNITNYRSSFWQGPTASRLPLFHQSTNSVHSFIDAFPSHSTCGLYVPLVTTVIFAQPQVVNQLCRWHGIWHVLFVGQDDEGNALHVNIVQNSMEFNTAFSDTITITAVHHI